MSSKKLTKLETYIEQHRPDFDAHEPYPDLWARLEQQLSQPGPGVGPVRRADEPSEADSQADLVRPSRTAAAEALTTEPGARPRRALLGRYGVAAALAALVVAAALSEAHRPAASDATVSTTTPDDAPAARAPADAAQFGPAPQALAAAARLGTADPRLTAAVRGMEGYYSSQLSARQAELRQLDAQNPAADWPRELASLDSSYRQLKEELPHHPQPEVVLTAMNRNLQIRLDILDQQLQHRADRRELAGRPGGSLVSLADSRSQP